MTRREVSDWDDVELGEVLTLQRGFDLPKRVRSRGPYPVVSSAGITGSHDEFKVAPPGVVIGRYGSLGLVHWVPEPFWPLNTSLWVKDFKGNDPRFVSYLLETVAMDGSAAAAVPGVNRNHLHKLKVRRPDLGTERRIAALLSAIDELIEINHRRMEVLAALARSIYLHWAKAHGWPTFGEVEQLTDQSTTQAKWELRAFGEVAEVVRGRSYRKSELGEEDGVPFLTLKCVQPGGGFRRDGLKRYSGPQKTAQRVEQGDILIAVTDMTQERRIVAQAFRVPDLGGEFAVPSLDLSIIRPRDARMNVYIYALLRYSGFAEQVREYANGANVLHLSNSAILGQRIPVPEVDVVLAFEGVLEPLLMESESLEVWNLQLRDMRDLLLPRLVTGRLDISDLELGVLTPTEPE